ncbi:MAG: glutaminase domain-containing protein [Acidobacteriota bacterium]
MRPLLKMRNLYSAGIGVFACTLCFLVNGISSFGQVRDGGTPFRPPAVPLITHDPYFSIWSMADHLTDVPTKHWTEIPQELCGIVRVDGKAYRFLGLCEQRRPSLPALQETQSEVTPTRTIAVMTSPEIELRVEFMTPAFPEDMALMARPVTYLRWEVKARDGRPHDVTLYLDAAGTLAVNDPGEEVTWSRSRINGLDLLQVGSEAQPVLQRFGDNVRINWGWFYIAVPQNETSETAAGNVSYRRAFLATGRIPDVDDIEGARTPQSHYPPAPALNVCLPLGKVGQSPVERHVLLAYNDLYSVEYMQRKLLPYWRTQFSTFAGMLEAAEKQYPVLEKRSKIFDNRLQSDLVQAGGVEYAHLATLAYRQAIAAQKLVEDTDGVPFFMPKENFSNGSISTVDVIYPSAPMFLLLNPKLVEAQLEPVLRYAEMPRWKFPFAPHDLGVYPLANGQQYGGGEQTEENQMPVEESGDLLLLVAATEHAEGNVTFARRYWPLLTKWAEYLKVKGLDPANQLCTDDFAGHLAHNANLSLKAIEALGAYGQLAQELNHPQIAQQYLSLAHSMALQWVKMAADGDHYRLAFDKPGTWSQKYNLVWDGILGLNLFSPDVSAREIAFYKKHLNRYGLPLDDRATYTKLDWELWTATLTRNAGDFQMFVHPVYEFLNDTPDRVPMTDWYDTITARQVHFQARSVVGGVYIKMLANPELWKKWASLPADTP